MSLTSFFLEAVKEPPVADCGLVDPSALPREPSWLQNALEVLSALQMDSEWLLSLSERDQMTIAEVVSSHEEGLMCAPSVT